MRFIQFIRQHRKELDQHITKALNCINHKPDDEERMQWVLNDEGLYRWARSEGVKI